MTSVLSGSFRRNRFVVDSVIKRMIERACVNHRVDDYAYTYMEMHNIFARKGAAVIYIYVHGNACHCLTIVQVDL